MGIQHILWTTANALRRERIRSNFIFLTPERVESGVGPKQERSSDNVSRKIAERLRGRGLNVSGVWRGSSPDSSGFNVRLTDFEVTFLLQMDLLNDNFDEYHGSASCSRPFWKHPSPDAVAEGLERICATIEVVLHEELHVVSLQRLTREQLRLSINDPS